MDYPTFSGKNPKAGPLPETPTALVRMVLPAILAETPGLTVSECYDALMKAADNRYGGAPPDVRTLFGKIVLKTVSNVLARPEFTGDLRGTKRHYRNAGTPAPAPALALAAAVPAKPARTPKPEGSRVAPRSRAPATPTAPPPAPPPAPEPPPATMGADGSGICQGDGRGLWADPPAKCVWGGLAGRSLMERQRIAGLLLSCVPPLGAPISASRIRRRAVTEDREVRHMSRANVAAVLLLMMKQGGLTLIAQHNPSRKRRINYLWMRSA